MNKIIHILLVFLFSLTIISCTSSDDGGGSGSDSSSTASDTESTDTETTDTSTTTTSLASSVISELSANLSSTSSSRHARVSSRSTSKTLTNSLTSAQITSLVDEATAAVTAVSLDSSEDLIQIMPKIIQVVNEVLDYGVNDFTVPTGKTLYILTISKREGDERSALYIDNKKFLQQYHCSINFNVPVIVSEGLTIKASSVGYKAAITGYLK